MEYFAAKSTTIPAFRPTNRSLWSTSAAAMKTQVPDKDGNMGKYKKADFKYDVAAGFIKF